MTTSTSPFRAPLEAGVRVLLPLTWSAGWTGTIDHIGLIQADLMNLDLQTAWTCAFATPAPTAAEEVARLRDAISDAAGLTKQEIARGIGVDWRSLSGFVTGEIRPTATRLRALQALADAATWAASRYGARARDVLSHDAGAGSALDMLAGGRTDVFADLEAAAASLGLVRRGEVTTRSRRTGRPPLYLEAREAWADRVDQPAQGGEVRNQSVYEQDLSEALPSPAHQQPRRRQI